MKKWLALSLLVTVLVLSMGCTPKPAEKLSFFVQTSSTTTSSHFPHGVAWGEIVSKYVPNVSVSVKEGTGTHQTIKIMQEGGALVGATMTLSSAYEVYHGIATYAGKAPWKDIRNLTFYNSGAVYYVMREDSGITEITQLVGKKISAGVGGATLSEAQAILDANGIKPDWQMLSITEGATAVKDRILVGFIKTGNGIQLDATMYDIKSTTPIRILSFTEEQRKKAKEATPWIGFITVPAGVIKDYPTTKPILTQIQVNGECTTTALSQEMGYLMVKAIYEHWPDMITAYGGSVKDPLNDCIAYWNDFDTPVPLHAGTVQYYEEKGIKVPAKMIPPEYKKK